jgi:hypothetical protein
MFCDSNIENFSQFGMAIQPLCISLGKFNSLIAQRAIQIIPSIEKKRKNAETNKIFSPKL